MAQTLEDLKSGKLKGVKKLKLACGLTTFPIEIFDLADTLEFLDLSDNLLTSLPDRITELKKLKIVFFARNRFTVFPSILSDFPILNMVGFKSNQISEVPEDSFPPSLNWLILTDNKITSLPQSIGKSALLQKCGLAGNQLEKLPAEMANCTNLELLRISANKFETLPQWLFELPKISWVAFAGNSVSENKKLEIDSFDWNEFEIKELLGEGASGLISRAEWKSKDVAVKVFKGEVTTDGLPIDEMRASIAAGTHPNLIKVLGDLNNHPEDKKGLVLDLISSDYINLGNPPSMETCTRDVFDDGCTFNKQALLKIAKSIASVCAHLHQKDINHGDLYAHNILINKNADCLFGDFGAASFYTSEIGALIERVEVCGFGCLIEDVLNLVKGIDSQESEKWNDLIAKCMDYNVADRPSFLNIVELLDRF